MHTDALSSFYYAAGEHQKDDVVIEVRERKWWRNDLEVGRSLFASLRGSCHMDLSWSVCHAYSNPLVFGQPGILPGFSLN